MVKVLGSFVRGPLESYVAGFAAELLRQGYSRSGADQHVCFIAHLDRWMFSEGIELGELSTSVMLRYLVQRRAAGYREYLSMKALAPLLAYLTPLGVLPVEAPVPLGLVEELLAGYRCYLLVERGLTAGTVRGYVDSMRPFLVTRVRGEMIDVAGISAADITGFISGACPGSCGRFSEVDRLRVAVAVGLVARDRADPSAAGGGGAAGRGVATVHGPEGFRARRGASLAG